MASRCLVFALVVASAPVNAGEESLWRKNFRHMFRRDEPRTFARTPEDLFEYLREGDGFYTQLSITSIWQVTREDDLLNVTYDFGGGWQLIEGTETSGGGFSWWLRGGTPVGVPSDSDLALEIGALGGVNTSLESDGIYLREGFWGHGLGERFRYTVGWIDPSFRYDFNAVANSEREYFIADGLVNSPGIPFPFPGLGLDFLWVADEAIDVHTGIYQSNCDITGLCLDKLGRDEWFIPFESTFKTSFAGMGRGNYRFLGFYNKVEGKSGSGFSLSFDQQIGRVTPFLRWSTSGGEASGIRRSLSLGLGIENLFGRTGDMAGLGFARSIPSNEALGAEKLIEIYWRYRFNPFVTLTPDLIVILDPAFRTDVDRITIFGVRLQLDF